MERLDTVLLALGNAVAALKSMTAKAKEATAQAESVAAQARAALGSVTAREEAVAAREKDIAGKEAAILSAEALAAEKDKVEEALVGLENFKKQAGYDLQERSGVLDQRAADLKSAEQELIKERAELEKDKATYKARIKSLLAEGLDEN